LQIDPEEDPHADDVNIIVNIDVNATRTAVDQLRRGSVDVPKELQDLHNAPWRSAPTAHATISDVHTDRHTDRRRCANVYIGRRPMTMEAIRRSLPTQPESPTQGSVIDLETHVLPPRW
jgi:hypothetical protein